MIRKYIKLILSARRYRRYLAGYTYINDEIFFIWNGADDYMKLIPNSWWEFN